MKGQDTLFSSVNQCWTTPQDLFDTLDREFHFTCDVAASAENTKCEKFFDEATDALKQEWKGVCFCNPPYALWQIFTKKAFDESRRGTTTVLLIPSRTDTIGFHRYILPFAEYRFIKGRLHFSNSKNAATFPSMIAIFRGEP